MNDIKDKTINDLTSLLIQSHGKISQQKKKLLKKTYKPVIEKQINKCCDIYLKSGIDDYLDNQSNRELLGRESIFD